MKNSHPTPEHRGASPSGTRRRWLRQIMLGSSAGLAALCILTAPALAQSSAAFPTKPIRWIVSYPPGGTADLLTRAIAEELSKRLGQSVVIENKPGANGNLGADIVAKASPDGHTLVTTAPGPLAVNESLYASLPFDPKTAFAPITRIAVAPLILVVPRALPVNNLNELLAYLKANPSKAQYASQGNASSGHLAMELLKARTGMEAVHTPYKGSAPALNDLLAGHVTMMFDNTTSSLPHVRSGALKALAVAELKRLIAAPEIPTVAEQGVAGFEATPWFAVVTTAGTPASTVSKLNATLREIVQMGSLRSRFAGMAVDLVADTPTEFATYIDSESRKWKDVVRRSGARAD